MAIISRQQDEEIKKVEGNLNECIISVAVSQATDKIEIENKLADIKTSLIYTENFQNNILLKKAIELDERTYTIEKQIQGNKTLCFLCNGYFVELTVNASKNNLQILIKLFDYLKMLSCKKICLENFTRSEIT